VAFGTFILSLTNDQFFELMETTDCIYNYHRNDPFPDQKTIRIATAARSVTMVFSVNELKDFISLLIEGRNKLQYKKLFVFNEN
jgi:hypothetical protein